MVELVVVNGAVLAGRQAQLPDADVLVLEHDAGADITQHTIVSAVGHACTLRHPCRPSRGNYLTESYNFHSVPTMAVDHLDAVERALEMLFRLNASRKVHARQAAHEGRHHLRDIGGALRACEQ